LAESNLDLQQLLNGGLPLDKVGPHLRYAARRALRSGDPERMLITTKVIVFELLRRGDLLRVAVEGDAPDTPLYCLIKGTTRLLDLSALGQDKQGLLLPDRFAKPVPPPAGVPPQGNASGQEGLLDIDSVLAAMERAQELDLSYPHSGETNTILLSVLGLLGRFTPQFRLYVMLFDETPLAEDQNQVFNQTGQVENLGWFKCREPGHSVWIPNSRELPPAIRENADEDHPLTVSVAVPLYDTLPMGESLTSRREAGLLFLTASDSWSRDTMLRLAARLSRFVTHRWQQHTEVNRLIHIDSLTGLFNRGYFDATLL